jgi:hypothetical protein
MPPQEPDSDTSFVSFESIVEMHSSEPEIDPQQHLYRREVELGREVSSRLRVYLDTRYWILIRDHINGKRTNSHIGAIYDLLRSLVSDGRAICPVSVHTVGEVLKQDDAETLSLTATLMDELSQSVAVIPEMRRVRREVRSFMNSGLIGGAELPPLIHEVWTKVYWLYVSMDPPLLGEWPPEQRRAAAKASIDACWRCTVSEYVNGKLTWPEELPPYKVLHDSFPEFAVSQLNIDKPTPESILRNFDNQFLAELDVALDVHNNDIEGIFDVLYEYQFGSDVGIAGAEKIRADAPVSQWIRTAFRDKRVGTQLPYFRIIPSIMVAYKHDRHRRYKRNDLTDFYNAASGIPYCDIYLTEQSFRHLLTTKPLRFDQVYNVKIVSDPAEGVRALHELLKPR